MVAQAPTQSAKPTKPIPLVSGEQPLVGSLFIHQKDRLSLYLRVARECGDAGRMHFGPFTVIQLNTPELVHSVLVEHANDFYKGRLMENAFRPVGGNGIFISEGELHRRQRKLMAPSFQPRQIINYANSMVYYGEQVQAEWQDGSVIDLDKQMTAITMSIIGKVLFDADVFTETDELGSAMATVLGHVSNTLSHIFPVPYSWPTPRNQRARRAMVVLDRRIKAMIDERRAQPEARDDFLSILLRAQEEDGSRMTDQQLRDEAMTLFGAGHETTATALTWAWYLLASHPEAYQKMLQEVDSVLQGRVPTYADLARLPYTLQVFKEAMRLYPPAYIVSRVALHDVEIADYLILKEHAVLLPMYVLHRDPKYFPDPEKFEPERFTTEKEKQLPRYAYMPFGAGPRICIGNHFAMMEGHLLLATLAQKVTFELVPGQRIEPDPNRSLTIRPKEGVKVVVRRR